MAGRIPEDFIDELLTRVDIVEVIDARVPLKKAGKEYTACCPFHDEKTPSFTVSPVKQFYHCFGCGAHGSAIGFLMDYEHLDFVSTIEELASRIGMPVPREENDVQDQAASRSNALYPLLEETQSFFTRQLREHTDAPRAVQYLKQRGLSGETAARFGIGFAPPGWRNLMQSFDSGQSTQALLEQAGMIIENDSGKKYDRFRDRIMFPIRDRRGRVIAFGGRILGDEKPKYLNSPETPVFHKGRELYGLYEACLAQRELAQLLVVEGYMDVVALAQAGINNAVATLGTATTPDHLDRLFRVTSELVFSFDGDRAGREAAWKALKVSLPSLRSGRQIRFLMLPDGEDPDTMVQKEGCDAFRSRMQAAQPLSDFYFERLSAQVDMESMDGRARLVELARPHFSLLPEGAFRELMLARLGEVSGMPGDALLRLLKSDVKAVATSRIKKRPAIRSVDKQTLTPIRSALALLIQNPELSQSVTDIDALKRLSLPGVDILLELIETLNNSPKLTTGALLERWRDTEKGKHLSKLAGWQLSVPEDGLQAEFLGAVSRLGEHSRSARIRSLLDKSAEEGLDEVEKRELAGLLNDQT